MAASRASRRRRRSRPRLEPALETRKRHAIRLVREGRLDPELAVALTCWPPSGSRLEEARYVSGYPAELAEEARQLFAAGWSCPAIAERLGVPFSTAKQWVWTDAPGGYRRDGEPPRVFAS